MLLYQDPSVRGRVSKKKNEIKAKGNTIFSIKSEVENQLEGLRLEVQRDHKFCFSEKLFNNENKTLT